MEAPLEKDRRRFKRYYYIRPCWCEGEEIAMFIVISNISKGGLFLKTANPLPIGRSALITFRPTSDREIIARVEVVWHSRGPVWGSRSTVSGMGTRLVDIVKGDKYFDMCLQSYIQAGRL